MELIFPSRISRNNAFCDVTDLTEAEQSQIERHHAELQRLVGHLDCPLHFDAPVFVHSTTQLGQFKSTLFTCCVRFTTEVEQALQPVSFPVRCLPTRDGYGRARAKKS